MDCSSPSTELNDLCSEHRFTLVRQLSASAGSRFIAHVAAPDGQHLFLKRLSGLRGYGEVPVLRAWQGLDCTPRNLQVIDPVTFACEWVDGVPMRQSQREMRDLLHEAGSVLRRLHAAEPPAALMPIPQRTSPEWVASDISPLLPAPMRLAAETAASHLRSHEADAVLLHGDFVPLNILVSGERLVVIDPIGFVGPAAWDIAQISVAASGRDRRENLRDVLTGYGAVPPLLEDALAYLALLFFGKALEGGPSLEDAHPETVAELRALAESLS